MRRHLLFLAVTASCFVAAASIAQTTDEGARPARDLMITACRRAADSLMHAAGIHGSPRVLVRFTAGEKTAFFRSTLIDAAASAAGTLYTDAGQADTIVTLGIDDAAVSYGDAFRERWFGEKKTVRTVAVGVRLEMQQGSTGKILYTGTITAASADTIAVDEIARLGASARHIAAGEPPASSFWEKLLEPAIVTVSSGIAIYLFFTVRS